MLNEKQKQNLTLMYGTTEEQLLKDLNATIHCGRNIVIEYETYAEILLETNDRKVKKRCKISKQDIEKVLSKRWYEGGKGYMYSHDGITLHRYLIQAKSRELVDHINHDTMDNRIENLRIVTHSQNNMNKKSLGVSFSKRERKWRAYIGINKQVISLGSFVNKEDAINARLEAEKTYYKEFAYANAKSY